MPIVKHSINYLQPTVSNSLKLALQAVNKKLAPGITAVYRSGRIAYTVRTSKTTENGTFKVNLGTFLSVEAATKALYTWKLYNKMPDPTDFVLDGNGSAMQQQLEALVYAAAEQEKQRQHEQVQLNAGNAIKEVAELQKYVDKFSDVGMEQILESVPFHELDANKDATIANEDGTVTVVPASVVAAYFKKLQNT